MYQNNRNLFSFFAVLAAAGLITAAGGLFLYLIDRSGSGAISTSDRSAVSVSSTPFASIQTDSTQTDSRQTNGAIAQSNPQATSKLLGSHSATVLSVAVTGTLANSLIASGSYDNTVKLWKSNSPEAVKLLNHSGRISDIAFTPNGKQLATGSGAGEIRLWDLATGELATTLFEKSGRVVSLAVNTDSSRIASGSSSGALKIWQINEGSNATEVKTLVSAGSQINAIAYSPIDAQKLISGDQEGTIKVWNSQQDQPLLTLQGNADRIASLAISGDGQHLASGSYDKTIRIWNLQTGALMQTLEGHDFAVADVAFSPDGKVLASASYDESIKTWNWTEGKELCTLKGHSGSVYSVAFTNGGTTLVSGGSDSTVRIWDLVSFSNQACLLP